MKPTIQHAVFCGATRFGKSELCLSLNVPRMRDRFDRAAQIWIDPPGSMATKAATHALSSGLSNVIVDEIRRTTGNPGYDFLSGSDNPDEMQRRAENRER